MVRHPFQPFPLTPKQNEGAPDPKDLRLELSRAELISGYDIETRLRFENWLWFIANHGLGPVSKR